MSQDQENIEACVLAGLADARDEGCPRDGKPHCPDCTAIIGETGLL